MPSAVAFAPALLLTPRRGVLGSSTALSSRSFVFAHRAMPESSSTRVAAPAKKPGTKPGKRRSRSGQAPPRASAKLPRVDVVFNPVSGAGDPDEDREEIRTVLGKGYHEVLFHETTPDIGAAELAWSALEDGASVVVASGGDGTVTEVADMIRRFVHGDGAEDEGKTGKDARAIRKAMSLGSPVKAGVATVETPAEAERVEEEEEVNALVREGLRAGVRGDGSKGGAGEGEFDDGIPRLGVIPRGTANAFCASIGIPSTIEGSATLINRATARRVDVARINGSDPMLLLCGVGLEAEVIKRADRSFKNRFGAAAYAFAGVQSVADQSTFKVSLVLEGVKQRTRVGGVEGAELTAEQVRLTGEDLAAVTIANSAPATSVLAQGIGDVQPDDGLLEVVCVSPSGRFATITSMVSMLKAALLRERGVARPEVYGLRARRVELSCDPPQRVVVDGEVAGVTPVVVELEKDAGARQILVVAPKAGAVTRRRRKLSRSLVRGFRNARGLVIMSGLIWGIRYIRSLQKDAARAIGAQDA